MKVDFSTGYPISASIFQMEAEAATPEKCCRCSIQNNDLHPWPWLKIIAKFEAPDCKQKQTLRLKVYSVGLSIAIPHAFS